MRRARILTSAAVIATMASAGVAHASDFQFKTVQLPNSNGTSEPRITVDPSGNFWAESNDPNGGAAVWGSKDGLTWTQTLTEPSGQTLATTDVDIVSLPSGRIVGTELDDGGINFRTSFSDDGGKTWTNSQGGSELADTDRPWLAADQRPNATNVYLLFHNLASGTVTHNMYVETSTDGGATFGAPIPITLPGSQAWADLQCADSGGPSNLIVAPPGAAHPGRVYAFWGTRSGGSINGVDASKTGGCGASVTGTFEINVVGATRIWSAYSDTPNDPTSWHDSLAVDDNTTGHLVGMQLNPGAVDRKGNIYAAYTESPTPYPNYDKASVKYVWAGPDLTKWSNSVLVEPGGAFGHVLPHIIAGDPGNLDIAYWTGQQDGSGSNAAIHWYTTVAHITDGLSDRPEISETRVATAPGYGRISSETGTASYIMGACASGPAAGIEGGFACGRTADVWGIALTPKCDLTLVWPVRTATKATESATWVTTQTGGEPLCDVDGRSVAKRRAAARSRARGLATASLRGAIRVRSSKR